MNSFRFSIDLPVLKADVNDYHHVAYEKYFYFFHQACIGYFAMFGHRAGGDNTGIDLIVANTRCAYKRELRLGDQISIGCRVVEIKPKGVEMDFVINRDGAVCATGSTSYLFFDYATKTVAAVPVGLAQGIREYDGLP